MKKQRHYERPAVLRELRFEPSGQLLAESVVDKMNVTSVGQEVEDTDWSQDGFNHEWGN